MTEREAYRQFNRAAREAWKLQRNLREADILIERIKAKQRESLILEYTNSLQNDTAFNRVLDAYTGHSPHGWEVACGCDGRMKRLLKDPGWGILKEVIRRVRWHKFAPKGELHAGNERPKHLTVEIKIGG